jgi:hypothetical protein
MKKKLKKIEPLCKNCRLYNESTGHCGVAVLVSGQQIHIPVESEDKCFFEEEQYFENKDGDIESFKPEVQQVKWWVEDEKGNKTDKDGNVKIEYPPGFFGKEKKDLEP